MSMALLLTATPAIPSAQPYAMSAKVERAWVLLERRDFQGALNVSERALQRSPNDPLALAARAYALQSLGHFDRAIADHDAVLRLTPNDAGALNNACWGRAVAGLELDVALTYCNAALAKAPRDAAKLDTRGFLHLKRGEFALALADYDLAIRMNRRIASPRFGRGIAQIRLGETVEGQADLAAATKMEAVVAEDFARWGMKP